MYKLTVVKTPCNLPSVKINSSLAGFTCVRNIYKEENLESDIYEYGIAIYLNRALETIGYKVISYGSDQATLMDIRCILQPAIGLLANAIMIVHNHPSNRIVPSEMDNKLTKELHSATKILKLDLVDHLIVASNFEAYYSYKDEGIVL